MKRELTNQELLDRYIHATMLPQDIAAEIRSNLESLIEDRAKQLGRELSLEELSDILKRHGHPLLVAMRYGERPTRALIGPVLFPVYWFALRAIVALVLTIKVFVAFTLPGQPDAGSFLLRFGLDMVLSAFFMFGGVTLVFAALEYFECRFRLDEKWKVESLPPVPSPVRPPKLHPSAQVLGGVAWLIFFGMALYSPWLSWAWGGRGLFIPSEALYTMRLPVWLLALFWTFLSWLGYTGFAASEWRRTLRTTVLAAGFVCAVFLLREGDLLVPGPQWNPAQTKSLATLNRMISGTLVMACIVSGLVCVQELRRYAAALGQRRSHA